jgi:hypothetical protein
MLVSIATDAHQSLMPFPSGQAFAFFKQDAQGTPSLRLSRALLQWRRKAPSSGQVTGQRSTRTWFRKATRIGRTLARLRAALLALACSLVLLLSCVDARLAPPVAASGTWVIQDETVIISNTILTHEGNIVVRGGGRLLVVNATLRLQQVASWQYSVRVEDAARLSIDTSRLDSKYPFTVLTSDSANVTFKDSNARRTAVEVTDFANATGVRSALLSLALSGESSTRIANCTLNSVTSTGAAHAELTGCSAIQLTYAQQSWVSLSNSSFDLLVCDGVNLADVTTCQLGGVHCWLSSRVQLAGCFVEDLVYSDDSALTIGNCSISELLAVSPNPLSAVDLRLGNVTLQGTANVSLTRCSAYQVWMGDQTYLSFVEGSAAIIWVNEWARASVMNCTGAGRSIINIWAYGDAQVNVTRTDVQSLDLGHRTRTRLVSSTANILYAWGYDPPWSYVYAENCTFGEEFRGAWSTHVVLNASTFRNHAVFYAFEQLDAWNCTFHELGVSEGEPASFATCNITRLQLEVDAQVTLKGCRTGVKVSDDKAVIVRSLPVGFVDYWNSNQSGCIQTVSWNLTVIDTVLDNWWLVLHYTPHYTVENCTFDSIEAIQSCSAEIDNVTARYVRLDGSCNITFRWSTITDLEAASSSFGCFTNCSVEHFYTWDLARTRFVACNVTDCPWITMHARSEYVGCSLAGMTLSDNYEATFDNCTIEGLVLWGSCKTVFTRTAITWGIGVHGTSTAEFYNCSVNGLGGYDSTSVRSESCNITGLYLYGSVQFVCANSHVEGIWCYDSAFAVFEGNLTGASYSWIGDSSTLKRILQVDVQDQFGDPIAGADVEVFASDHSLLLARQTGPGGRCYFVLAFQAQNRSLTASFSLVVTFDGRNATVFFNVTSSQPLHIMLDLSVPQPLPEPTRELPALNQADELLNGSAPSDEAPELDTETDASDTCRETISCEEPAQPCRTPPTDWLLLFVRALVLTDTCLADTPFRGRTFCTFNTYPRGS